MPLSNKRRRISPGVFRQVQHSQQKSTENEVDIDFEFHSSGSDNRVEVDLTTHDNAVVELTPKTFKKQVAASKKTRSSGNKTFKSKRKQTTLTSLAESTSKRKLNLTAKRKYEPSTTKRGSTINEGDGTKTSNYHNTQIETVNDNIDDDDGDDDDDDPIVEDDDLVYEPRSVKERSKNATKHESPNTQFLHKVPLTFSKSVSRHQTLEEQSSDLELNQMLMKSDQSGSTPTKLESRSSQSVELWVEKYAPKGFSSIALHKKKYQDVKDWFESVFSGRLKQRVLLLCGPAGTSKTALLSVLSRELNFDIIEWTNPGSVADYEPGTEYMSLSGLFSDFLAKSQAFSAADMTTEVLENEDVFDIRASTLRMRKRRVILIEDIPSVLFTVSQAQRAFLDAIAVFLNASAPHSPPMVIVISELDPRDDSSGLSTFSADSILGRDITHHPMLTKLQFNPVNKTLITRTLRDIATQEGFILEQFKRRNKNTLNKGVDEVIGGLAELGDIRSAINAFQWWATTGAKVDSCGRETYLELFHAVGKILYNKSDAVGDITVEDAILQSVPVSSLVPSLFENYPPSCGEASQLEACSSLLSDSDLLLAVGGTVGRRMTEIGDGVSTNLAHCGAEVAIRGIMCSLSPPPIVRKPVSIEDFVRFSDDSTNCRSKSLSTSPHTSSLCRSMSYYVYKKQQLLTAEVIRYMSFKRAGIETCALSTYETASDYIASTAFWEALSKKDEWIRQLGGQYNRFNLTFDDDHDRNTIKDVSLDQMYESVSDLILQDDDIEDSG
ncbi:Rad17 cell cycle checkpoint protein-domain-containing protein [Lipomyces arxii]|uniref:Rad17 cell cycle checkpoint protein-domain-containing protein n=1 Tax=Lipomyces arxii TaxID=56418 RepID=UPI0034CF6F1A